MAACAMCGATADGDGDLCESCSQAADPGD
ncbi:hypothetical protein BJ970_002126 [Saccharopolyspora phatthalungensis]|uniref:Uncharacterized protein n=1 Tax=Saccharopolyspora phatthalungensis TaxID=664693 RepID=A0A840PWD7_9PSEU|nr:hypothetical protein [Saccharopolyspora phatthalungensis]